MLAHGNLYRHLNLYEVTPHTHAIKKHVLNITDFIYKIVDEVAAEAISIVQHILCEDTLYSIVEAKVIYLAETTIMVHHIMCEDKLCYTTETEGECLKYDTVARSDCREDDQTKSISSLGLSVR